MLRLRLTLVAVAALLACEPTSCESEKGDPRALRGEENEAASPAQEEPLDGAEITSDRTSSASEGDPVPEEVRNQANTISANARTRARRYGDDLDAFYKGADATHGVSGIWVRCEDLQVCRGDGLCAGYLWHESCREASPDVCAKMSPCIDEGRCTFSAGRCVVGGPADCRQASACHSSGQCSFKEGECVAISRSDCAGAHVCHVKGMCTPKNGLCLALKDGDCRSTGMCEVSGQCHARDGACVADTERDCERPCALYGRCVARGGECVALAAEHCVNSRACKVDQECYPRDGGCHTAHMAAVYDHAGGTMRPILGMRVIDLAALESGQVKPWNPLGWSLPGEERPGEERGEERIEQERTKERGEEREQERTKVPPQKKK